MEKSHATKTTALSAHGFVIRPATPEDAPAILQCLRAAFEPYRSQYTPQAWLDTVMTPDTLLQRLKTMTVLVAVDACGDIVGTIGGAALSSSEGHLRGMAVPPEHHGCGIAQSLLNAIEKHLLAKGCTRISLDTTEPLHRAMRFYEKNAFCRTGKSPISSACPSSSTPSPSRGPSLFVQPPKSSPLAAFRLHQRKAMHRKAHPWGTPPWTVDFRPTSRPLPDHVDFAIIGGGFSGLSAAAWLRRLAPRRSVLLLESVSLGEGASGRTGGMALTETAAGDLPGLGNVLAGYKKILRALRIDSRLTLPGVWELSRSAPSKKNSPISWNDSGELKVVRRVPGGTVDPGKVVAGLARAAEKAGAQIVEHAEVRKLDFANPMRLRVRYNQRGRIHRKVIRAEKVLLATNALSLELPGLRAAAEPKLTFALATAPLSAAQLKALGLSSRHPFYTVDLPYLWGRLLESNAVIFGAGLVPRYVGPPSRFPLDARSIKNRAHNLHRYDVREGQSAARLRWLENRVRHSHPALASVRITHRWGGPILLTEKMLPIFRHHPRSKHVIILAGYNGHGVALSVYLGKWAAEALLSRRSLPRWH